MDVLVALHRDGALCAPRVGRWTPSVGRGDALGAGRDLGTLRVLGRRIRVVAPAGVAGEVADEPVRGAVEYGQALLRVGDRSSVQGASTAAGEVADDRGDWTVRSPIDGIFYSRPAPDAPNFVEAGDEVSHGQTLGLVEVMKTFNPVRYGAPGAPTRGRILRVVPEDRSEVSAGAALFVIESLQ